MAAPLSTQNGCIPDLFKSLRCAELINLFLEKSVSFTIQLWTPPVVIILTLFPAADEEDTTSIKLSTDSCWCITEAHLYLTEVC